MNMNGFPLDDQVDPHAPARARRASFRVIAMLVVLAVLVSPLFVWSVVETVNNPGATLLITFNSPTLQPSSAPAQPLTTPPPDQGTTVGVDRLVRFTSDPNQDSQTLGVAPTDLLQRAAEGDGWQVGHVTFAVYYHTCVDLEPGLSDQEMQSRINAPIVWISHEVPGATRVFIAGQGTAEGKATIYSESSGCPPQ